MMHDMKKDFDREAFEGEVGSMTNGLEDTDIKLYYFNHSKVLSASRDSECGMMTDGEIEGMTLYTFLHCSYCRFTLVLGKKTQFKSFSSDPWFCLCLGKNMGG